MYRCFVLNCFVLALSTICLSTPATAQNGFVGSEKCIACHAGIYETWKESTHYKAIQALTPENDWVIADWQGEAKLKTREIPEATMFLAMWRAM